METKSAPHSHPATRSHRTREETLSLQSWREMKSQCGTRMYVITICLQYLHFMWHNMAYSKIVLPVPLNSLHFPLDSFRFPFLFLSLPLHSRMVGMVAYVRMQMFGVRCCISWCCLCIFVLCCFLYVFSCSFCVL